MMYNDNKKLNTKEKLIAMLDSEKEELEVLAKEDKMIEEALKRLEQTNEEDIVVEWMSPEKEQAMLRRTYELEAEERGEKRGMKEGIKQEKLSTAKNLIKIGIDIETISKATGLSKKELSKLV